MSLDSSEQLATKAREMFHKCLNRSIPTGNLYSGGLGAYYLLLEQSRYHGLVAQMQHINNNNSINKNSSSTKHNSSNHNYSTPFRCKRLLKQALEGAQTATNRFKRSNSYKRSNISLLGGEWVGSHTLLAVCYRRLEDFSKRQKEQQEQQSQLPSHGDGQSNTASSISSPLVTTSLGRNEAAGVASSGALLFSNSKQWGTPKRSMPSSSGKSVASDRSYGGASVRSMRSIGASTVATTNPRPRSQQIADKILYRLEKQHLASDNMDTDYDDLTYSTFGSNYTNNTLSSMAMAAVWNQDVLGGRAGALQAIWWLRKEFNDGSLGQDLVVSLAAKILEEGHSTAASMGFHNIGSNNNSNSKEQPLSDEGQNHEDCEADNNSNCYCDSDNNDESELIGELLFWVCDSQGSHKAYLGAARGVVGILHTLLGLSHGDWELVEEQIPNARVCVRHTIDVFLPTRTNAIAIASTNVNVSVNASVSSAENFSTNHEDPSGHVTTLNQQQHKGEFAAETIRRNALHERFLYSHPSPTDAETTQPESISGNLRPRLDASKDSDNTVDWFHGATGLAMLFLQASKVFRSKEYLQEAHRLCDAVIFPRGLVEQRKPVPTGRGGGSIGTNSSRAGRTIGPLNKKGPVGLASMAVCFLQLSQLCSNNNEAETNNNTEIEMSGENNSEEPTNTDHATEGLVPKTSLQKLWKTRAALYAQHAHQEWVNYLKATPTATGVWNAYSLYEGMGGLISLLWQLSLSTFPIEEATAFNSSLEKEDSMGVLIQMPLYGLGSVNDSTNATTTTEEALEPIVLSHGDVTLSEPSEEILRPISLPKIRKTQAVVRGSSKVLAESQRRRALAEAKAKRQAEEAEKMRTDQVKAQQAVLKAQRRVELESRRKAQLLARKRGLEVARQKEEEASKNAAKKEEEDKSKRESLLLARRQAKERVEAKRRAKEEEEESKKAAKKVEEDQSKRDALLLARKQAKERVEASRRVKEEEALANAKAEAERRAIDVEKKRKATEEEAKKRRSLAEARLRRQKKEAELATQKEEERKQKEEADCLRRAKEFKEKEEQRKQRLAELKKRQLRMGEIAKEKEKRRLLQEEGDRERLEKESKVKEEERKKRDAERRRRLEFLKEQRKKEEQVSTTQNITKEENVGRKSEARKALNSKEKRRLQLREDRLKKQREMQEEKLRKELQRALDKEVENQKREECLRVQELEELKMQESINAIHQLENPQPSQAPTASQNAVYSPSFLERKSLNPSHFSVPTKSSLFWSLQSDSNIGSSESYRPALVEVDSPPSSALISTDLE
jgi:hypothetical protein